jgi:hypothetical protein
MYSIQNNTSDSQRMFTPLGILAFNLNTLLCIFQCIPYSVLLQELDMKNVRDLEDLIIEAIYAGKNFFVILLQKRQCSIYASQIESNRSQGRAVHY